MVKKITKKELNGIKKIIDNHPKYGPESKLIKKALKKNRLNKDVTTVATKICLIDHTNGTNLTRNLGTDGGLYRLSKKITEIDFDKRVRKGDPTLVTEIAKWAKKEETIKTGLLSFASKYCLYHNVNCYKRDDYVIYDTIVSKHLMDYINPDQYFKDTNGKKISKTYCTSTIKKNFNYEEYKEIIDYILKINKIDSDYKHRKFDWLVWYTNRPPKDKKVMK